MSDVPPPPPPPPGASPSPAGGLDVGAAVGYAWKKFQENAAQLILIVLAIFVVALVVNLIGMNVGGGLFVSLAFIAIGFVVQQVVQLGVIRASLMITSGEKPEVGTVFKTDRIGDYIVASILAGLIIGVGIILCVIPGILALIFLSFYGYFVLDRGLGATEALSASFNLVKSNFGSVFVLLLVAWLLGLAGAIACGIGVLVTIPMTWIMIAYAYRSLNGQSVAP